MAEPEVRRGVAFLTAPPSLARPIFAAARARFPGVRWTVYFRASDRAALGDALDAVECHSDKPVGSKWAFVAALRAQRFDLAVVAWTGHRDYDRAKVLALLAGARSVWVCPDAARGFALEGVGLRGLAFARWRPSLGGDAQRSLSAALAALAYKRTVGAVLAGARLAWRAWRLRRRDA